MTVVLVAEAPQMPTSRENAEAWLFEILNRKSLRARARNTLRRHRPA
jgi:hypothetical protein